MDRVEGIRELLDGPLDPPTLAGNLRDLARVNRLLGGAALSSRAVRLVLDALPAGHAVRLLDVGTGAADIPLALLRAADHAGKAMVIEAVDVRPEIVDAARLRASADPRVTVVASTRGQLDYPDRSFEIVHASLLLHHHDPEDAEELLRRLARVSSRAVIVNDLERARRWYLAAWALARVATGNRYTRHDAPLSVRRAYTVEEMSALGRSAGLVERARLRDRLGHRYALVFARAE
jgi:ubiquinone/menaquinone biosynthesis C-methylase UbiE